MKERIGVAEDLHQDTMTKLGLLNSEFDMFSRTWLSEPGLALTAQISSMSSRSSMAG
jgi:hypothetical protein